jgi:hypothetical protein
MTPTPFHQELQRLSAALSALHARGLGDRVSLTLQDGFDTDLSLVFRHQGSHVRGSIRSRAGSADFEVYRVGERVAFRHPGVRHLAALRTPASSYAGAASVRFSLSVEQLSERIVKSARLLHHTAVLSRVQNALQQRRRASAKRAA